MGRLCAIGSEAKPGKPGRVWFDDGFFCRLLSVRHPLCRMIDRLWFQVGQALSLPNPNQAPRTASRFLWSFAVGFGRGSVRDAAVSGIAVADLCATEPDPPEDTITYLDLVAFLLGESDELLGKVYKYWLWEQWFQNCQCRPTLVPSEPPDFTPVVGPGLSIPYCGGVVNGPSAFAIQQCVNSLVPTVQRGFQKNAQAEADFYNLAAQKLAEEPLAEVKGDYWEIGYFGYSGKIARGWILQDVPGDSVDCPTKFPDYLLPTGQERTICNDPAGTIDTAFLVLPGPWKQLTYIEKTTTGLIAVKPRDDAYNIPPDTVLSISEFHDFVHWGKVCWYIRTTPNFPPCSQGGSGGTWTTGTGVPPQNSDDERLCRDIPQLCEFTKPDCCGGSSVLITSESLVDLAEALGFDVSEFREVGE